MFSIDTAISFICNPEQGGLVDIVFCLDRHLWKDLASSI